MKLRLWLLLLVVEGREDEWEDEWEGWEEWYCFTGRAVIYPKKTTPLQLKVNCPSADRSHSELRFTVQMQTDAAS